MTDAEIIAAYEAGQSTHHLARRLGCCAQTAGRRLKALGVKLRPAFDRGMLPLEVYHKPKDDDYLAAVLAARPAGFLGHWSYRPGGFLHGRGVA